VSVAESSVIILVADGLGTDTLDAAFARGDLPNLLALRDAGGRFDLTTVFPSVTGPAYLPFLTGRFPGPAGIPGLRWYDRRRGLPWWLGHSRSYVGPQLRRIDADLRSAVPTVAELVGGSALGAQAMITRGIPRRSRLDQTLAFTAGVIHAHLTGNAAAWAALEEGLADRLVARVRRERPRYVFAVFLGHDKAAHSGGTGSETAHRSLRLMDETVGRLRADAERDGRWPRMELWVVSDHGHAPVAAHYDLATAFQASGLRVRAHPWTVPDRSDVAVMVSGNAMAHLYVDLASRERRPWPALRSRWEDRLRPALDHAAVDVVAMQRTETEVEVRRRGHGSAIIEWRDDCCSYRPVDGDPLEQGSFERLAPPDVHERTAGGAYPDAALQLASLVLSDRCGDVVISATPGWDLRSRFEPVAHVSSHGGLHRQHMTVPLVVGRSPKGVPRRTVDLFPSALRALGIPLTTECDGSSFL
jgi:hypothetical protein